MADLYHMRASNSKIVNVLALASANEGVGLCREWEAGCHHNLALWTLMRRYASDTRVDIHHVIANRCRHRGMT